MFHIRFMCESFAKEIIQIAVHLYWCYAFEHFAEKVVEHAKRFEVMPTNINIDVRWEKFPRLYNVVILSGEIIKNNMKALSNYIEVYHKFWFLNNILRDIIFDKVWFVL